MDTSGLASEALKVVTTFLGSTASASGAEVWNLVRNRLQRSPQGSDAVARLTESPQDPDAMESARTILADELSDQRFAHTLAEILTINKSTTQGVGSIAISSSKIKGSQISLGPLSITNNKTTQSSLAVILAVLIAALVLLVYHFFGAKEAEHAPSVTKGSQKASEKDGSGLKGNWGMEKMKKSLPLAEDMPGGWSVASGPTLDAASEIRGGEDCGTARDFVCKKADYFGQVIYAKASESIIFQIDAFADEQDAQVYFEQISKTKKSDDQYSVSKSFSTQGERSLTTHWNAGSEEKWAVLFLRGSAVDLVQSNGVNKANLQKMLNTFKRKIEIADK
ncbi:hypothetical protein ACFVAQ_09190 [Streptomyces sp. NPDC057651]|uniref:hypothetical protein n=1 Tax=Streptomyces sp. NPDC057651 TaxID=3346194 RepID=UPI0036A7393F